VERQASVMAREAGGITQHIGATEVPAELLNEACEEMMGGRKFKSPGLLFIDTPGHHSFTSLRNRGGALADIAILVVDLMEGLQPQTIESLNILRKQKTPFVVAANKIDLLHGWV
jgi:translation initiation factor 5B